MAYQISELPTLKRYFQSCFHAPISRFYDKWMTAARAEVVIDIVLFNEYLHKKHGDYEAQGKSMTDIIIEHYGDEALALIDELI